MKNLDGSYWWEDRNEIAALIRYLAGRGDFGPDPNAAPTDIAYIVEKPWKWDDDYEEMLVARARQRGRDLNPISSRP